MMTSLEFSEYDVISNFGSLISHSFHRKLGFFVTFLFLNQLSLDLVQGLKIGFLFQAQKVVLGTISDNMTQTIVLRYFLAKCLLEIVLLWQDLKS